MIHSQGEVVNSIESSVEYATVNVESGTQELREAANYKVILVIPCLLKAVCLSVRTVKMNTCIFF